MPLHRSETVIINTRIIPLESMDVSNNDINRVISTGICCFALLFKHKKQCNLYLYCRCDSTEYHDLLHYFTTMKVNTEHNNYDIFSYNSLPKIESMLMNIINLAFVLIIILFCAS